MRNGQSIDDDLGEVISTRQRLNVSGDTMTVKTARYPTAQRDLVRWLYGHAKNNGWNWGDLEALTGISSTTIFRIWTGIYADGRTGPCADISDECRKIERLRQTAAEPTVLDHQGFVETTVFQRISKICDEAMLCHTIAMIYGESQIGKTASLKEYVRREHYGQTIYVLMPASAGVQSMMRAIAEACHISTRACFDSLRNRLLRCLDDTKLLILDEVHEVFVSYHKQATVRCMSVLRQLQEQTQCGLVLCGTNVFRNHIERGEFAQSLKQLRKRGIWELQLENTPSPTDIALIYRHHKLGKPSGEAARLVKHVTTEHGMGKFTKFMVRATQVAASRRERFQWKHFEEVVGASALMREMPKS
jgi:DNA transposition AAA+ family ATPase